MTGDIDYSKNNMDWDALIPDHYNELVHQRTTTPTYPMAHPGVVRVEYHRLQIETWLYDNRDLMLSPAIDIGAEFRHDFIPDLITVNHHMYQLEYAVMERELDLLGSITSLPFQTGSLRTILCLETLEHVFNIFRAVSEISRVLAPGGILFASSPWFWPTHGNGNFMDYWRIAPDGWKALLFSNGFKSVTVTPCRLRTGSQAHMHAIGAWEVYSQQGEYTTGYMVQAVKG